MYKVIPGVSLPGEMKDDASHRDTEIEVWNWIFFRWRRQKNSTLQRTLGSRKKITSVEFDGQNKDISCVERTQTIRLKMTALVKERNLSQSYRARSS